MNVAARRYTRTANALAVKNQLKNKMDNRKIIHHGDTGIWRYETAEDRLLEILSKKERISVNSYAPVESQDNKYENLLPIDDIFDSSDFEAQND